VAAAELADRCFKQLRAARLRRSLPIDTDVDPLETGLVGAAMTPATSHSGLLAAKQASINPNFAAVVVEMLKTAGVRQGDTVAVGYSGSFPALNVCTLAALETLQLKSVGISSASASQWGANFPEFLWLDMEQELYQAGLIARRSVAASLGGVEDRGLGMTSETRAALQAGIARSGLTTLEAPSFTRSVDQRMEIYQQQASPARIKAYINVGGGTTSVGKTLGKRLLRSGLNTSLPRRAHDIDSVMTRFLKLDVPVVHLIRVADLARRYGLPEELTTRAPRVGEGQVFERRDYNRWYASLVLVGIVGCLYAFIRSDWGFRVFHAVRQRSALGQPEPMV
jgi:poly-gamma-glutamate system protein